jgi:hypothetical protein
MGSITIFVPLPTFGGYVARKDPEVTKAYDRARKAAKRAEIKANPPTLVLRPRKKPGKTPFASFIKVKAVRRDGKVDSGVFYVDMAVGPYFFSGQRYDARKGQLQWTSCESERLRPRLSRAYYAATVRPIVIASVEKFLTEEKGKPTRLPAKFRFPVSLRKPKQPVEMAAD